MKTKPRQTRNRRYGQMVLRIRPTTSYSAAEIVELLRVHENTVRKWLKAGLIPMDDGYPLRVRGVELIRFLRGLVAATKRPCAPDEMYCLCCKQPRHPDPLSIATEIRSAHQGWSGGFAPRAEQGCIAFVGLKTWTA